MLSFVAHCAHHGLEIVSYESHAEGTLQRREEDHRYAFMARDHGRAGDDGRGPRGRRP